MSENPLGHCRLFQPKLEKAIADLHADRYLSSEADKFFVRLGQSLAAMKRQRPIEAQQERRPGEQPNPARREQQPITEKDFRALARILREEELSPRDSMADCFGSLAARLALHRRHLRGPRAIWRAAMTAFMTEMLHSAPDRDSGR